MVHIFLSQMSDKIIRMESIRQKISLHEKIWLIISVLIRLFNCSMRTLSCRIPSPLRQTFIHFYLSGRWMLDYWIQKLLSQDKELQSTNIV